ncbi:hypothetical protein GCM10012275_13500 [Longimycelium tulufanense]|uniref:Glycosyltransferase RgtA/B/C/D-like domain-containing protein n=1 Tax=Longimycelium tulufanense TaxID=907463 RepID=A0A8J3C941_9PSEU|nr:hypothetical protein GCM10012275_13500 [Longimycelium tulufanense]
MSGSRPWRALIGNPWWERPALLVLVLATALGYGWELDRNQLLNYYSAAVRSMSQSWTTFVFGAQDPSGTLTLDKLPGSFWLEALSVRAFGFHNWSVLLPHVAEAVLAVIVLHRVTRRWWGPVAGILAAAALAVTPMVGALAKAEIADMLLMLLLLLAVAAWQRSVETGRLRWLLLSGVWVGFAFHVKMVQAWAVLPALGVGYLVAAGRNPAVLWRRAGQLLLAGVTTLAVSSLWIVLVLLTPASARPYVDGSMDNSPISMVFGYNALGRFGVGDDLGMGGGLGAQIGSGTGTHWLYLLSDQVAPQVGWLYPLALAGLLLGIAWPDPAPRAAWARAGCVMWGVWLLAHVVAFSLGHVAHSFYVAALAPPVAALAATALTTMWSAYRQEGWRKWLLPLMIAVSTVWSAYLASRFPGFLPWLAPSVVVTGSLAVVVLVIGRIVSARASERSPGARPWTTHVLAAGGFLGVVTVLLAPSAWAATTVVPNPDAVSFDPAAGPRKIPAAEFDKSARRNQKTFDYLRSRRQGEKYLFAASSMIAASATAAGESVLPFGGFSGSLPAPSVDHVADLVSRRELRYVILGNILSGRKRPEPPVAGWVRLNCSQVDPKEYGGGGRTVTLPPTDSGRPISFRYDLQLYDCRPGG